MYPDDPTQAILSLVIAVILTIIALNKKNKK